MHGKALGGLQVNCPLLLFNFNKTGIYYHVSIKLPNITFDESSFSGSQVDTCRLPV
jgi:hypothetical protein